MDEPKPDVDVLFGGDVYLWTDAGAAVHLKAVTAFGDPVELSAGEVEVLIGVLQKRLKEIE